MKIDHIGYAVRRIDRAISSFEKLGFVFENGVVDDLDRNILRTMIEKFGGGPVGLDTLAAAIGEDAGTIEDVYEPYLIKNGLINRTPRGRVVTDLGLQHMDGHI